MQDLSSAQALVNDWMREHGARYALKRHGRQQVTDNPFDPIPRRLPGAEFTFLEQGLIQRISALNLFVNDIYHSRMILRDGVIPEEFIFSSPDFRPECMNITPIKSIYAHITATDLLRTADGSWYAMEDSLSVPNGITYPYFARKLCRELDPDRYNIPDLCDNCGLDILLRHLYRDICSENPSLSDGIVAVLSEGDDSLSSFELHYMASLTGAVAAKADELIVMDNKVYYRAPDGGFKRVSILHRLAPDQALDPLCFDEKSPCGIPHLMEVYCAGNIAILNAPGCSVAEDRGLSYFVPAMIRYYLDEEPLLSAVPTYLPWYPDQRDYILSNMDRLIIKDVDSTRPTGAVRGASLDADGKRNLSAQITADPRRFIAQEILEPEMLPVLSPDGTDGTAPCDFRAYTVHSDSIRVWMGGLSRFTVHLADGKSVSGFKDTWVMAD